MGFFEIFKKKENNQEEINSYLATAKTHLRQAHTLITRFLEGTKEFQPARRHEDLYNIEIKQKLNDMRAVLVQGNIFLDKKLKENITYQDGKVKSSEELKRLVDNIIITLRHDDEKQNNGIIKKLNNEMWSEERKNRGFPVPNNHQVLIETLHSARDSLKQLSLDLESYNLQQIN